MIMRQTNAKRMKKKINNIVQTVHELLFCFSFDHLENVENGHCRKNCDERKSVHTVQRNAYGDS